jgi:hypothetical protein
MKISIGLLYNEWQNFGCGCKYDKINILEKDTYTCALLDFSILLNQCD